MKRTSHSDAGAIRRAETHAIGSAQPAGVSKENRRLTSIPDRSSDRGSVIGNTRIVEVRIGELVLNGFSPADRFPIADAVERELTRLFSEEGIPLSLSRPAEVGRLSGGAFRVAPSERQTSIGEKVARAIYGGLR